MEEHEKCVEQWKKVVKMDASDENKRSLRAAERALARSKEVNYYKVLNLKKDASLDEIKQAYRKRALLHHPGTFFVA